jgi:SAM-dependent methyltransferase
MRMCSWTPDIIRYMEDASRWTTYFSVVASAVRAVVPEGGTVCDAGCGMGQLSFEMAEFAGHVDAFDKNPNAIAYVNERLSRESIDMRRTISVHCRDYATYRPEQPYDCMVFSLSANVYEACRIAAQIGCSHAVVVNKIRSFDIHPLEQPIITPEFDRPGLVAAHRSVEHLARRGILSQGSDMAIEYGQPFRTLSDARQYLRMFRSRTYPNGISDDELASILVTTGDGEFPFYLPITRHVGIVTIDIAASQAAQAERACVSA